MKNFSDKNINTNRKICDSHVHMGLWQGGEFLKSDLDSLIFNNDSRMLVSTLNCIWHKSLTDEYTGNSKLLEELKDDVRYLVLAACRPNLTKGDTKSLELLLNQYPKRIFGLKFHPREMDLAPKENSEYYAPYLELAKQHNLPCLFHSEGEGVSSVNDIYGLAKMYPDVPIILGHMGAGGKEAHNKAIEVFEQSLKNNDADLYVDISWVDWKDALPSKEKPSVLKVIDTAIKYNSRDKILFGTDAPLGCFGECPSGGLTFNEAYGESISTLENVIDKNFPDEARDLKDRIFYENAAKLYGF